MIADVQEDRKMQIPVSQKPRLLDQPPFFLKAIVWLWPIMWGLLGLFAYRWLNVIDRESPLFAVFCVAVLVVPLANLGAPNAFYFLKAHLSKSIWSWTRCITLSYSGVPFLYSVIG